MLFLIGRPVCVAFHCRVGSSGTAASAKSEQSGSDGSQKKKRKSEKIKNIYIKKKILTGKISKRSVNEK